MKKRLFALCFTIAIFFAANAAELITIRGKVKTEDTGEYLDFVSISIKGTTKGTISNADGSYEIATTKTSDIILFNYMGYKILEVEAGELRKSPNVELIPLSLNLQEVVVKAFQEDEVIQKCINNATKLYPSEPVIRKAQIKDITVENRKIQSYYDFSANLWVKSFDRRDEEHNPITMRILNVTAGIDRYTDSIPIRPYMLYDKTVRNIIPENYALRTLQSLIRSELVKWHSVKDTVAGEPVWRMHFESKEPQPDTRSQAIINKVLGLVIAAQADSAILRIEMTEEFSNYMNISYFTAPNKQRLQCIADFSKQQHLTNFRRVGNKIYPEYTKTTVFSELKFGGNTIKRQQLSLILIGEVQTENVKKIAKKDAYNKEQPLYRQIDVKNESWRTINSLPLTKEEKAFIDANK